MARTKAITKAKAKTTFRIPLRVVVYRHGEWWIAHCLELDLVAEGKTLQDALTDVMDLSCSQIEAAIRDGDLESVFRPAPPEAWAMFSRATDVPVKQKPTCPVERFEAREAVLA